jgi:hypothetical protein
MRVLIALIVIAACIAGAADAVEKPIMFRFKSVGVNENIVEATMMLFKGSLDEEGKYQPVYVDYQTAGIECFEPDCAARYGRMEGYDKAIVGSLTQLGYKIIVRVQLVDTQSGDVIFTEQGVADTEEDMDMVLARLAKSVTSEKKFEETAEVGMITERETLDEKRRESYSSKGLRAGFIWPIDKSFGNMVDRLIVIDFAYQYELPDFFLMGRSGLRWGHGGLDVCFLDAMIGRYLNRGDFTPFINGGLGVHYIQGKGLIKREHHDNGYYTEVIWEDGTYGLLLLGGAGFTAFRTYDFQFQIDVDYFIMLDKINEDEVGGADARRPQGVLFTFCIRKD